MAITRFVRGWVKLQLPIVGKVAVIDQGEPAVGLSAMQLNALGIHSGIVTLQFNNRTCDAKIWNAGGPNSTNREDEICIADSVAQELRCKKGDDIYFIKIVTDILPARIGIVS